MALEDASIPGASKPGASNARRAELKLKIPAHAFQPSTVRPPQPVSLPSLVAPVSRPPPPFSRPPPPFSLGAPVSMPPPPPPYRYAQRDIFRLFF